MAFGAGDGWNDTFENITRVSEYNNVRIGHDVSLNTSIYWKDWVKQGIVVDTDTVDDDDYVRYPCVIREDDTYKMWYSGSSNGGTSYNTMYATSINGENWDKQGIVMSPGGVFDSDDVRTPYVLNDGGTYKMWYGGSDGSNYRVMYATSIDGIAWTKQGMVLDVGGVQETVMVSSPCVAIEDGTYKMWYAGYDGSNWRIFYATSSDGVSWVKQGLIMDYGDSTPEAISILFPTVIKTDGIYYMWYTGKTTIENRLTILSATSVDGINWNKKGLEINYGDVAGEDTSVSESCVLREDDGSLKMWYSGTDWVPVNKYRTLLATMDYRSFEPMSWDKQGIAVEIGGYPEDSTGTSNQATIKDDGIYKMWYVGSDGGNGRILYADSIDGEVWNKQGMVMDISISGQTDDAHITSPFVMKEGNNLPPLVEDDTLQAFYETAIRADPRTA